MTLNEIDAVRADGGLVHIRPVAGADRAALDALDERVSDRSIRLRYFQTSRQAAQEDIDRMLRPAGDDHEVLVALARDELVGVASFEQVGPDEAELALLVDDRHHHEGIGTLLIEQLADAARARGIQRFIADVLVENAPMMEVLRNLGFGMQLSSDHGTTRAVIDLCPSEQLRAAIAEREREADAISLRPVLAPRSVAVVGAGERAHSVGREVLANILDGGFTGELAVVNPRHDSVLGVPSVPGIGRLAQPPDLAVIAVPAAAVPEVVRDCGEHGVKALLVLTAGFGETGASGAGEQQELVATARRYGMRLVGPNCLGVVNTDPAVRLDATFARIPMQRGPLALVSQSGALGIAVLVAAQRMGVGTAQFVSMGNKADVSGNDLLLAWELDDSVSVIALYLESFGNPRKFARIARRVSRRKPIIAIKAGRSRAGRRAGLSHTAAAASSDVAVDALFAQAGVVRVDSMEQMLDCARVLAGQPLPRGGRVAVFGNSGGPGILAADAAESAGLQVVEFEASVVEAIGAAVPSVASAQNPVDLGAGAQPDQIGAVFDLLQASDQVDMILGVFTETLVAPPADIMQACRSRYPAGGKTLVWTQVGEIDQSEPIAGSADVLPIFAFPEQAATALGLAHRYARIRREPSEDVERPGGLDPEAARGVVTSALARGEQWLSATDIAALLASYGVGTVRQRVVSDAEAAVEAAREVGFPVAVKVSAGGAHKSELGGVRLGVATDDAVIEAFDAVRQAVGLSADVLVQPMAGEGLEMIAGVVQDEQFGPLVLIGFGGTWADVLEDRQVRLAPVSRPHADAMVRGLRAQRVLDGFRGIPAVSREALADLVVRLGTLADDLPEIAELDLNPVVCRGSDLVVVDARIRVAPAPFRLDPTARYLPVRRR